MTVVKQHEVLRRASLFLAAHDCEVKIAEILLQHYMQVSRAEFFFQMQEAVPEEVIEKLKNDIQKHVETGVPVQHLLGYETFYSRDFLVNEHVLIPRTETEEVVMHALAIAKGIAKSKPLTIVDVGTGSGIIAATLALELPEAKIYATDISKKALTIAKKNVEQLEARVTFLEGDFLKPLIDQGIKADIIVSNPPYIAYSEAENLDRTVKNFDPDLALFADEDGLAAYKQIIAQAPNVLNQPAQLIFEIGYQQGAAVKNLITETFPTSEVEIIKDINENDRIVSCFIK